MKKFIKKIILFSIIILKISFVLFYIMQIYYNHSFSDKNAIFIWGDSQAYHGIDLEELSAITNKNIYSSAFHGAGVYDFLLFTERISPNSKVIVSISKLVQIRRKENDFNRSGLSLGALNKLHEYNYSFEEIVQILKMNLKPKRNIFKETSLYPYKDSIEIKHNLSHFKSYYEKIPEFLNDKQSLYLLGIKNLIDKNCIISFIEFPSHKDLENIEKCSPARHQIRGLNKKILLMFDKCQIDSITINKERNIYKDYSHLNCLGAKDLSNKLGVKIDKQKNTTIYVAK